MAKQPIIPVEIERYILWLRGEKVLLDEQLASLYEVEVRALVQAVSRNKSRFPDDFMFRLTREEWDELKSQNVIAKPSGRGGRRTAPYAFTEQGVAMLSSVLRSKRAVEVNIEIMRAFVRLRRMVGSQKQLARRIEVLERKYDQQFKVVFDALRAMMAEEDSPKSPIGFETERVGRQKKKKK